jgi:phosphoglycolate phosphatase
VDTAPDLIRSANLYLKSKGLKELSEARIRAEIGLGLRRLILDLFPTEARDEELKKQIEQEFLAIYEQEYLRTPRLFDGALEFLQEFDGLVGIVSNKRERFIKPILRQLGLDSHPWVRIVGGDTYSQMKPHPEPFLKVIEAAGVTPEETLIVGDGSPDVEGATAIGSRSVAVSFGYTSVDELMGLGAWRSIESFHELQPLIDSIT